MIVLPFGATGVGQVVEAYTQLKGKAGERQVKAPENALVHNMGGTGSTSVVHILGGKLEIQGNRVIEK